MHCNREPSWFLQPRDYSAAERPFFRAVVPIRSVNTDGATEEMPVTQLGLATDADPRGGAGGLILKMGGVCEHRSNRYGLQILLFP
jgi:hypothetical protein